MPRVLHEFFNRVKANLSFHTSCMCYSKSKYKLYSLRSISCYVFDYDNHDTQGRMIHKTLKLSAIIPLESTPIVVRIIIRLSLRPIFAVFI